MNKKINKKRILLEIISFIIAIILVNYFVDNQLYVSYIYLFLLIIFYLVKRLIRKKYK